MATGAERSKALHNFTLPGDLRWGNQRFLRCMKVNSDGRISPIRRLAADDSCYSDQRHRGGDFTQPRRVGTGKDRDRDRERDSSSESTHGSHRVRAAPTPVGRRFSDDDGGIAATREKLMFDLRAQADEMKDAILKDGLKESEVSAPPPPPPPPPPPVAASATVDGEGHRPWNLRTRRAVYKAPASRLIYSSAVAAASNDSAVRKDSPKSNPVFPLSQPGSSTAGDKSPWLRSGGSPAAGTVCEKRQRSKFSVALSKSEIEEDFLNLVGHRPPRRPKKRARVVQRQLDTLFPGLWLTEVTPDMYKVNETAQ